MPVPETALDEHGDPLPSKNQIRPARHVLCVEAVAESSTVHFTSKEHFGLRVTASNARHHAGSNFAADDINHQNKAWMCRRLLV